MHGIAVSVVNNLARLKSSARRSTFDGLFYCLNKAFPDLLVEKLSGVVRKLVDERALDATLASMNRQGLLHCFVCPARFNLVNVGRVKACRTHANDVRELLDKKDAATKEKAA